LSPAKHHNNTADTIDEESWSCPTECVDHSLYYR
jgi:hypothetical protein